MDISIISDCKNNLCRINEKGKQSVYNGFLLSEREASIVKLFAENVDENRKHFPRKFLEKIGERFGITQERVRQILTKAIRKLRVKNRMNDDPLRSE